LQAKDTKKFPGQVIYPQQPAKPPQSTLTATEKYKTAEAKVKEAFNLSEIGESIFQQQTQLIGKRSRSNSKILI
jgi:hypothetical protein